ncbi:MAG TPA: hypothetical protein PLG94_17080, partial [Smithellaceae bacterium]|nr:hypothetical protein [Smithellaceae bacterium]
MGLKIQKSNELNFISRIIRSDRPGREIILQQHGYNIPRLAAKSGTRVCLAVHTRDHQAACFFTQATYLSIQSCRNC